MIASATDKVLYRLGLLNIPESVYLMLGNPEMEDSPLNGMCKTIGHLLKVSVGLLLMMALLPDVASPETLIPTLVHFNLSRDARFALSSVACRPSNVGMQASDGIDYDDNDRKEYDAGARCAPHATIYKQPVVFERFCTYAGSWKCDPASETLLSKFADRRVHITAEGVSLTEAYWIVNYFVSNKLIEPVNLIDDFDRVSHSPLDTCHVSAKNEKELELKCRSDQRWVERIQSDGAIRYRQIPLPWCATQNNAAGVLPQLAASLK